MPCQQAKRFGGESRCREPPDVCTREMGFLTSAELYWDFLPKIASRVYTRDALSGKDWPQLPINRGNVTTGQDHVRNLVLCVHAGWTFCRWEGLGEGWTALLPCGQAPRVKDDRGMLPPAPATRR